MHDNWQEAIERIERYAMPVASDKARKAASKQTWRSKRAAKKVAKAITGIHKRRRRT